MFELNRIKIGKDIICVPVFYKTPYMLVLSIRGSGPKQQQYTLLWTEYTSENLFYEQQYTDKIKYVAAP